MNVTKAETKPYSKPVYQGKNPVNFTANILISDLARGVLKEKVTDFYKKCNWFQKRRFFGGEQFDFEKIFDRYKKSVEKATENIRGVIKLAVAPEKRSSVEIFFDALNGSWIRSRKMPGQERIIVELRPEDILQDRLFSFKKPMRHAIMISEAKLSQLFAMNGYKSNEFGYLLNKKRA